MTAEKRDHIFISYRRDDARGSSGRLYDWLRIAFGREHVFRDVSSIGIGKWRERIDGALARSKLCVAVVGPRWADAENLPRLHRDDDMVRHELVSALACDDLSIVPTLVEGAKVPATDELPAALRPLFEHWNALLVTEEGWDDDIRRLIENIVEVTSLPAASNVDTLLRDVCAARQRVAELEESRHLQAEQLEAQRRTIDGLTRRLAEASAGERSALMAAFAALARGDSRAAEEAFEREYDAQSRLVDSARKTMAEAARNVANLALSRDIGKAITFYRKSLELEADNTETLRLLASAFMSLGDLRVAEAALVESQRVAISKGDDWGEMAALGGIGDVRLGLGDLANARTAYARSLSLAECLSANGPANTEWQRDLSVGHSKVGDVLAAQGDGVGALDAYRTSHDIFEALAGRDPANTEWQRDVAVSRTRIGDMLAAQGDGVGALAAYHMSHGIFEALAGRDPANTKWQHDLSVSHEKIGDVLVAQGDGAGALVAYFTVLTIREALTGRDPVNTEWQRDVGACHIRIGDVLLATGDGSGALAAYRMALAVAEALAGRDPANALWQRDLAVSHIKVGDVLVAQGDGAEALAEYRTTLTIAEALAGRDPANIEWQRDQAVSHERIGNLLETQGDRAGALAAYQKSNEFFEALTARAPANNECQHGLSVSHIKIGDVLMAQGDGARALATYSTALKIAKALAGRDPANTKWPRGVAVSHMKIGDVLTAQGDGAGALAAYRTSHEVIEALAGHDPTNVWWQVDLAVACSKLGSHNSVSTSDRRAFLLQGCRVLKDLQCRGRLHANQDYVAWFELSLAALPRQ